MILDLAGNSGPACWELFDSIFLYQEMRGPEVGSQYYHQEDGHREMSYYFLWRLTRMSGDTIARHATFLISLGILSRKGGEQLKGQKTQPWRYFLNMDTVETLYRVWSDFERIRDEFSPRNLRGINTENPNNMLPFSPRSLHCNVIDYIRYLTLTSPNGETEPLRDSVLWCAYHEIRKLKLNTDIRDIRSGFASRGWRLGGLQLSGPELDALVENGWFHEGYFTKTYERFKDDGDLAIRRMLFNEGWHKKYADEEHEKYKEFMRQQCIKSREKEKNVPLAEGAEWLARVRQGFGQNRPAAQAGQETKYEASS
jgi:hypothetical protein